MSVYTQKARSFWYTHLKTAKTHPELHWITTYYTLVACFTILKFLISTVRQLFGAVLDILKY